MQEVCRYQSRKVWFNLCWSKHNKEVVVASRRNQSLLWEDHEGSCIKILAIDVSDLEVEVQVDERVVLDGEFVSSLSVHQGRLEVHLCCLALVTSIVTNKGCFESKSSFTSLYLFNIRLLNSINELSSRFFRFVDLEIFFRCCFLFLSWRFSTFCTLFGSCSLGSLCLLSPSLLFLLSFIHDFLELRWSYHSNSFHGIVPIFESCSFRSVFCLLLFNDNCLTQELYSIIRD
jgi:hypothetical protein